MKLTLKSVEGACIYNFSTASNQTPKFIGVRFQDGHLVWTDEAESVEACGEYVRAVKCGELAAADEATAKYCGVVWVEAKAEEPKADAPESK